MDDDDFFMDGPDRIAGWLAVAEWTPRTAAYLFLNLDPDCTEAPTDRQGWFCDWICRDEKLLSEHELAHVIADERGDTHDRDKNLTLELERMLRLTSTVNEIDIRSPDHWILWARKHELLPGWLADSLQSPPASVVCETSEPTVLDMKNAVSAAGGQARHDQSPIGGIKSELRERIYTWAASDHPGTITAFASALYEELCERFHNSETEGPSMQTLQRWASAAKRGKRF
jgi:hypothetical protein